MTNAKEMTPETQQTPDKEVHSEHDVPAGGYFTPKLYLQRYDFVKNYINESNAKTVIDLGCAECKFVKELAMMDLRRVIGVDLDRQVIENGSNYFKPNFDDYYNPYYRRKESLLIELYKGDACEMADPRILGVDFVSCIELIEHINPEDHHGIIKTIFRDIKPLTAVITTPNGDFNSHWPTMPHGKYRHEDHRFEWTRTEFAEFVSNIIQQYPEYEVTYDGIGDHWGGDNSKGSCSQAAIFKLIDIKQRAVMNHEKKNVDELLNEEADTFEGTYTYEKSFSMVIHKYNFEDRIYKAVMRALDPFLGIATQNNDLHDVNSNNEYEYNKTLPGVHHDTPDFYNKPVVTSSEWFPESGICVQLDEEYAQPRSTIKKIGVKTRPKLRNFFKYNFDDAEYTVKSHYADDESSAEEGDGSEPISNTEPSSKPIDIHWKVSKWHTDYIEPQEPLPVGDGWSDSSSRKSSVSMNVRDDAFGKEGFTVKYSDFSQDNKESKLNMEEIANKIHGVQLKMKIEAVEGQFDDYQNDDNEPPPEIRRFEELMSAESVDYTEDDGFTLRAVLNFFTVKAVMQKNEILDEDMDSLLIETLMALKIAGKTDFDIFQTKKGQIRVKLCPVSKYDHDNQESDDSYNPVDINDVKDYSSAGSEW